MLLGQRDQRQIRACQACAARHTPRAQNARVPAQQRRRGGLWLRGHTARPIAGAAVFILSVILLRESKRLASPLLRFPLKNSMDPRADRALGATGHDHQGSFLGSYPKKNDRFPGRRVGPQGRVCRRLSLLTSYIFAEAADRRPPSKRRSTARRVACRAAGSGVWLGGRKLEGATERSRGITRGPPHREARCLTGSRCETQSATPCAWRIPPPSTSRAVALQHPKIGQGRLCRPCRDRTLAPPAAVAPTPPGS